MGNDRYPQLQTDVEVTLMGGEVKVHTITAGLGVSQYLAEQASSSGVLVLFNGSESNCYPLSQIHSYRLFNERKVV